MNNVLEVNTSDGQTHKINVIDIFTVEDFPEKEYIAYTFGEESDNGMIKSYVSILTENNDSFNIDSITNKDEWNIVKENFKNLLVDESGGNNE